MIYAREPWVVLPKFMDIYATDPSTDPGLNDVIKSLGLLGNALISSKRC